MENQLKINKLEIENVKRVKAVLVKPTENGLTIIGGNNKQGKTSVLDSIAWGLGGNKFKPSKVKREESITPPILKITMSNGLVVERKGKNSDLKVIDPKGEKAGQQLLDSFVEELALDLPKFISANNKEKANILLNIIGVGDKLADLEHKEKEIYNERRTIGQIADQKKKFAKEQEYYPDAPKNIISARELIEKQQAILAKNGENQRKRMNLNSIEKEYEVLLNEEERLLKELEQLRDKKARAEEDLRVAKLSVEDLQDESTEELEQSINNIETINVKVRTNLDKEKAEEDAREYEEKYNQLSIKLDKVRDEKTSLLDNADLPLEGLSVEDGELIYQGFKWDGLSGADQLKVATAIVRKLNPNCGFVLMDKLEQMDLDTLKEFGSWIEEEGLQVIATRVSKGDECSIIIEDGYVVEDRTSKEAPKWKAGTF